VWVADLTITQLFLENVEVTERGVVGGVQGSLNQLMDLLKYALVVVIPDTETYGFLIMVSFGFIFSAWMLYALYLRREGVSLCSGCCCCRDRQEGFELRHQQDHDDDDTITTCRQSASV
jgi:hypothetical protein